MEHPRAHCTLNRFHEALYYSVSALLTFLALSAGAAGIRFACLSILVTGQATYGLLQRYRGQPAVYLLATCALIEVVRPFNVDILRDYGSFPGIYYAGIYALGLIVSGYGFELGFLKDGRSGKTVVNILLFVFLLLLLVVSTSSSLFLTGHRLTASGRSLLSIALVAVWFIPWLGAVMKAFDAARRLIGGEARPRAFDFTLLFAVGTATGLTYLSLFSPGLTSIDSFGQWDQAMGRMPLSDWHPYLHTLALRWLAAIYPSPIMLPLLQILLSAFVYASWGAFLLRRGANRTYVYLLLFIFSLLPLHAMLNITLWKDVLYTLALAFLTLQFAKITALKGRFFRSMHNSVSFVVSTILVWNLRHNGFVVGVTATVALAACLIFYMARNGRGERTIARSACAMIALILASQVVFRVILPGGLGVIPNPRGAKYATFLSPLGAIARDGLPLDAETSALMERIMPLDDWKDKYAKYSVGDYLWDTEGAFIESSSRLDTWTVLWTYVRTLRRHPAHVVAERMNQTANLWNMTDFVSPIYTLPYTYEKDMRERGMPTYTSPGGRRLIRFLQRHSQWLFNLGIYSVILALLLYYVILRGTYRLCVLYIPLIANGISLAIAMPSTDYRFGYYVFELCPFVFTFILVEMNRHGNE
ncbi:MAG: DUF6020 family protein [bacterium]|nr:DUF6020 family protein [bacterium]